MKKGTTAIAAWLIVLLTWFPHAALANVIAWGENGSGNLGNNSNVDSALPVSVITSGALAGKTITQVSASFSNGACALSSDGMVYCWGVNSSGELGDGTNTPSDVPVAVDQSGALAGKTVTAITSGVASRCALTSDGKVFCWGDNSSGQLGDNNGGVDSNVPSPVTGIVATKTVTSIKCGGLFCLALTDEGLVYSWGENGSGQLGNADGTNTDLDVSTGVDATGALSGKTVVAIAAASETGYALTSDGLVFSWGESDAGQLGNNSVGLDALSPVAVYTSGLLNGKTVSKIAASGDSGYALTSDNGLYAWGEAGLGQLGNNSAVDSSVPDAVDVSGVLAGKTIAAVVGGGSTAYALTTDGLIASWGGGASGQLGDGTFAASAGAPVLVSLAAVLSGRVVSALGASTASAFAVLAAAPLPAAVPTLSSFAQIILVMLMAFVFALRMSKRT